LHNSQLIMHNNDTVTFYVIHTIQKAKLNNPVTEVGLHVDSMRFAVGLNIVVGAVSPVRDI